MFAFPRIEIPGKAKQEAAERGLVPDEFYCLRLLEETGESTVALCKTIIICILVNLTRSVFL